MWEWTELTAFQDFLTECGGITNLSSLTMTTEAIDIWQWISEYDGSLFFTDPDQDPDQNEDEDEDEDEDEEIWSGGGDKSCVHPHVVGKAFETCTNLRELSFVFAHEMRTWAIVETGQEAHGADGKVFKTCDSVNLKHALCMSRTDYSSDRWF